MALEAKLFGEAAKVELRGQLGLVRARRRIPGIGGVGGLGAAGAAEAVDPLAEGDRVVRLARLAVRLSFRRAPVRDPVVGAVWPLPAAVVGTVHLQS